MKTCSSGFFLFTLVVGGALSLTSAQASPDLTDATINHAIERCMNQSQLIDANGVTGEVHDGIATLSGTVDNFMAKRMAVRIAETVKGVRSVVDRIEVKAPAGISNEEIKEDVKRALMYDPATDSYEVDVTVHDDGEVTLSGTVQSWSEKDLTEKVAGSVPGVRSIRNDITLKYSSDRPDSEIANDIEQSLKWSALVDADNIDVSVDDGRVTLSGYVATAAEKRVARTLAWSAGVTSVDIKKLEVRRWKDGDEMRRRRVASKSPQELKQAVRDALSFDPRVFSFNVTPEVRGSTVTLRGTVDNLKAKRAAASCARNTVGVRYVRNYLHVRPTLNPTDDQIKENIRTSLRKDPIVDPHEIHVDVRNGVAYLYGDVSNYTERAQADDIASRANGVTSVRNRLSVEQPYALTYDPYVFDWYVYSYPWYPRQPLWTASYSDAEIKDDIQDELWWSPFVDADQVNVQVKDGVATLTGTVDSWSERRAATANAYDGGAVWVNNRLKLADESHG